MIGGLVTGAALRVVAPFALVGVLGVGMTACQHAQQAAGAAKYRAAVLQGIADDNAAVATRDRDRAKRLRERERDLAQRWDDREARHRQALADARQPPVEGFQCPDADTWAQLLRCPFSRP